MGVVGFLLSKLCEAHVCPVGCQQAFKLRQRSAPFVSEVVERICSSRRTDQRRLKQQIRPLGAALFHRWDRSLCSACTRSGRFALYCVRRGPSASRRAQRPGHVPSLREGSCKHRKLQADPVPQFWQQKSGHGAASDERVRRLLHLRLTAPLGESLDSLGR